MGPKFHHRTTLGISYEFHKLDDFLDTSSIKQNSPFKIVKIKFKLFFVCPMKRYSQKTSMSWMNSIIFTNFLNVIDNVVFLRKMAKKVQ